MRYVLVPSGFVAGALAGFMAEIGIASILGQWAGLRIDLPLVLVPIVPAIVGIAGAVLLLQIVRRLCGPAPSLLALVNALATVVLIMLIMVATLAVVANPFDDSPPSATRAAAYALSMLAPIVAMALAAGALRR